MDCITPYLRTRGQICFGVLCPPLFIPPSPSLLLRETEFFKVFVKFTAVAMHELVHFWSLW